MNSSHVIKPYSLDNESNKIMYVLTRRGKSSFIDVLQRKDRSKAQQIANTARMIIERGLDWAFAAERIKPIKGAPKNLALFETRVNGGVVRVATYLHNSTIPIYMFYFITHSGSGNNFPENEKQKAIKAVPIAKQAAIEFFQK